MTVAASDGESIWVFRYSSEKSTSSLYFSTDVTAGASAVSGAGGPRPSWEPTPASSSPSRCVTYREHGTRSRRVRGVSCGRARTRSSPSCHWLPEPDDERAGPAHARRRADAAGTRGAVRARRHPVGRRPAPVPAGGVRRRGDLGGRPVRRRRLRRRTARGDTRRQQRGDRVAAVRRPRRPDGAAVRPLRRAAAAGRGRLAHAAVRASPRSTAAGTAAARPTARATSSCTSPRCARSATTFRSTSSWSSRDPRSRAPAASRRSCPSTPTCCAPTPSSSPTPATPPSAIPRVTISLRGMVNVVVTVEALASEMHSGMFGGAAPDALAALVAMLATPARRARQHHRPRPGPHPDLGRCALPARAVPQRRRRARRGRAAGRRHGRRHALGPPGDHRPRHRLPARGRIGRGDRAPGQRAPEPAHPAGRHTRAARERPSSITCARWRPGSVRVTVDVEASGDAVPAGYGRTRLRRDGRGDAAPPTAARSSSWGRAARSRCAASSRTTYPEAEIILIGVEEPLAPDPRAQRERATRRRSPTWRSRRHCSSRSTRPP